jgi:hypothetical protein
MIRQTPLSGPLSYQKIRYSYMYNGKHFQKTIHYLSDFHEKRGICKDPSISLIPLVKNSLSSLEKDTPVDFLIEIGKGYEKYWNPFDNPNYLNSWVIALQKCGCLKNDPSQLAICKTHFPYSQFVECDLRQELFIEYQTFIDKWYNEIGSKIHVRLHYDSLHSF